MTGAIEHQSSIARFAGWGLGLIAVVVATALIHPGPVGTAIAVLAAMALLAGIYRQLRLAWARTRAGEDNSQVLREQAQLARAEQQKISADVGLLGNYGNLLLGSTD